MIAFPKCVIAIGHSTGHSEIYFNTSSIPMSLDYSIQGKDGIYGNPISINVHDVESNNRVKISIDNIDYPVKIRMNLLTTFPESHMSAKVPYEFLIENGDSVVISMYNNSYVFSGRGSAKFAFLFSHEQNNRELLKIQVPLSNENDEMIDYFKKVDSLEALDERNLQTYNNSITTNMNDYMLMDLRLYYESIKIGQLYFWRGNFDTTESFSRLIAYKNTVWNSVNVDIYQDRFNNYPNSNFIQAIYNHFWFDSCFISGKKIDLVDYNLYLIGKIKSPLRDYAIKNLVEMNLNKDSNVVQCIEISLSKIHQNDVYEYLSNVYKRIHPGEMAYNFSLVDTAGNIVHLSDFKGKVVLLDFWFAHCGPCAQIHPYLEKLRIQYKNRDFALIAINTDVDVNTWKKSIENGLRSSKENVNLYTNGDGNDCPVVKNFNVTGFPTLILIDKNGRVLKPPTDPRIDGGKDLASLISKVLN